MTLNAWIFMISVWAIVLSATGYCFFRLLTSDQRLDSHDD